MTNNIVKADPTYRKKVIVLTLLTLLIGFILLAFAMPILDRSIASQKPEYALKVISYTLAVLMLIPGLLSLVILRIGIMTIKQKCYPPEGVKVFKDTILLTDEAAVKRGRIGIMFAIAIMLLCFAGAALAINFMGVLA
jgi:hypothetical protein